MVRAITPSPILLVVLCVAICCGPVWGQYYQGTAAETEETTTETKAPPTRSDSEIKALLGDLLRGQEKLGEEIVLLKQKLKAAKLSRSKDLKVKSLPLDPKTVALKAELKETKTKLASLKKAIEGGLDPEVVKEPMAKLQTKIKKLHLKLKAPPVVTEKKPQTHPMHGDVQCLKDCTGQLKILLSEIGESHAAPEEEADSYDPIGITLDIGFASVYMFRGWNVFMEEHYGDPNGLFAPGLTYGWDNGMWVSYWSAYQTNGGNMEEMTDIALGHEQDLIVGYDTELIPDKLSLSTCLVYYFYPFACKEANDGVGNPSFLEPGVSLSCAGSADLGLDLAYFTEVQSDLPDLGYLYIHPSIGKSFPVGGEREISFSMGYGYKVYDDSDVEDYKHDLSFDFEVPFQVESGMSVTPGIHFNWTNIEDHSRGGEYVVWAGLNTGFEI